MQSRKPHTKPPRQPLVPVAEHMRTTSRMATRGDLMTIACGDPQHTERAISKLLKTGDRRDQRIRDSAKDEECSVRIPGVCDGGGPTTVWSHFPGLDADRGMGMKAVDICGCYCCGPCHDVVDMRAKAPAGYSRAEVLLDWFAGHLRSLVRLRQKGLV